MPTPDTKHKLQFQVGGEGAGLGGEEITAVVGYVMYVMYV